MYSFNKISGKNCGMVRTKKLEKREENIADSLRLRSMTQGQEETVFEEHYEYMSAQELFISAQ